MSMQTETKMKIPVQFLPENWKSLGASQFNLTERTITSIVKGQRNNTKVFDFMLDLALQGKEAADERIKRLKALNQ